MDFKYFTTEYAIKTHDTIIKIIMKEISRIENYSGPSLKTIFREKAMQS